MNKKITIIVSVIILIGIGFFIYDTSIIYNKIKEDPNKVISTPCVYDSPNLEGYYITFDFKNNKYDENGVLLYDYPPQDMYDVYHIVRIAEYALSQYTKYIETKDEKYKERFLNQAKWYLDNIKTGEIDNRTIGVWTCDYDFFLLRKPFIGAMGQGEILSVLTRAYKLTNDKEYLKAAEYAKNSFFILVEKGGISYEENGKTVFFEEFPIIPPTHVMNGFIFSWWGLYDYYQLTKDPEVKVILDDSLNYFKKNLNKYDSGFYSYYDVQEPGYSGTSIDYHLVHVIQMDSLYKLTKDKIFKKYRDKWENNSKSFTDLLVYNLVHKLYKIKRLFWRTTNTMPYKDTKDIVDTCFFYDVECKK